MLHDSPDDRAHDPEGPSEADIQRFGRDTVRCPECGDEVHDEAEVCHSCGRALHSPAESARLPLWAIAVAVGLLAVIVLLALQAI